MVKTNKRDVNNSSGITVWKVLSFDPYVPMTMPPSIRITSPDI